MTGNLTTTGNIGIGANTPQRLLHIRGTNPTYLRIETSNSLANETTGIEFGILGYGAASYARITSTTSDNYTNNIQFLTSSGENTSSAKMTILGNGNVGIGTTDPKALLNVYGKTLIHNALALAPANGFYGNDGTRLILWPGTDTNVAYSLGLTAMRHGRRCRGL